jgi:hypothetical protein
MRCAGLGLVEAEIPVLIRARFLAVVELVRCYELDIQNHVTTTLALTTSST